MPTSNKKWIGSFSGLRFWIVVLLVLHHFDMFNDLQIPGWNNVMTILSEGYLSVNFFFILSGFVIQYSYGQSIANGLISGTNFIFNRLSHLYPTYLVCLLLALYFYTGSFELVKTSDFYVHLLMLQSWVPKDGFAFQFNGLAWAVSNELFFYFVFVFLAGTSFKRLCVLCACCWGGVVILIYLVNLNMGAPNWFYYISPSTRLAEFLLGMILCVCFQNFNSGISTRTATYWEFFAILFVAISVILAARLQLPWIYRWQLYYTLPCSLLIFVFAFDKGWISQQLSSRIMQYLGRIAFPLYLCHQICLALVKRHFIDKLTDVESLLFAGLSALVFAIICSILLDKYIGSPCNTYLRSFTNRHLSKK